MPSLLDYFPESKGDGLRVTWASEVNTKSRLAALLRGPTMVIEGDLSMASHSRYPVPTLGDLTLEEWLLEVAGARRGARLNFRSTEVVEPACRVLARLPVSSGFLGCTHEMTERMLALVKEYSLTQPVMFPMSAASLAASVPEVQRLLFHVPGSCLVVTPPAAGPGDLPAIRAAFPRAQVFYALPDHYLAAIT
ncbi:FAM151B [Cordylochernes scorpioides]|uniref:FAM151B n=1 Tax=Cordylochernes scorpioides TaxID=51811 RepID=A0ABY6K901_9ARAC|nr:FAM151B [Cordylochernes scorpioides]